MKKKQQKPDLMERTRAAVTVLNTQQDANDDAAHMAAFLDLFHPEMSEKKKHALVQDARRKQ